MQIIDYIIPYNIKYLDRVQLFSDTYLNQNGYAVFVQHSSHFRVRNFDGHKFRSWT